MGVAKNWIVFYCLFRKECIRINRIWVQTLIPPLITMTLYFIIFGNLIGSQIADIHGVTYIQFIVPGLVMMSMIVHSYMNVCSSFYSAKFQKSVEELLVSPAENLTIILGFSSGGVYRALLVGAIVMMIALFFTHIHIHSFAVIFVFAVLTSCLFSLLGLVNALYAEKFDDVAIIPTFVLTPLTYLGGVFYSVDQLSPLFQLISKLNPILYMVNGFRYGFLGQADIDPTYGMVILILANLLALWGNIYLFKIGKGIRS